MDLKNAIYQYTNWYPILSALGVGIINLLKFLIPSIPDKVNFWVSILFVALTVVFVIIKYISDKHKNKLRFSIIGKCREPVKAEHTNSEPVDSDWSIRVHSPNRPVKKCKILLNDKELPWWDKKELYYERDILLGDGGNVRIPRNDFPDDILWHAEGEIKEGKKTKETFRLAELKDVCKRKYST